MKNTIFEAMSKVPYEVRLRVNTYCNWVILNPRITYQQKRIFKSVDIKM
jgi:hypothetical protein